METKPEIIKLNIEGEICPYPLITTIKKYQEIKENLESGKRILEVTTDHPPAYENIPREFRKKGFQVEVEKMGPAKWKIIIKK